MKDLIVVFIVFLLAASAFADKDTSFLPAADVAPDVGPASLYPPVDDQWDLLFWLNLPSWDYQHYGCEFAGGHFYITASGFPNWPNIVLILDRNGNWVGYFGQWSEPGWGWRDLAYDYTYLYGSDDTVIDAFDLEGNPVPEMNITGCPISPCRALAYDEVTDHFWTQTFSGPLHEIDRSGASLWSGSSGATAYGAAFDNAAPDGPWLWIFSQTGSPNTTFHKFDPIGHAPTGFVYQLPLLPGLTDQVAGGAFFTEEWDPAYWVLGGIVQGTPYDILFCLEMYPNILPPDISITLVPVAYPIQIPAAGGSFDFYALIANNEANAVEVDLWIDAILPDSSTFGPLTGPTSLNLEPGTIGWFRTQNVPGAAPAGSYAYFARAGIHPDVVWEFDSFEFEKLETGDGAWIGDWNNWGDPLVEESTTATEVLPQQFELHPAHPNPFNPTTTISFSLPEDARVALKVYDISGRLIAELMDGWRQAGIHEVIFDASGLAAGVYIYRLTGGGKSTSAKMVLMK